MNRGSVLAPGLRRAFGCGGFRAGLLKPEAAGGSKILFGEFRVALRVISAAAVEEGFGVVGLEGRGLIEVADGFGSLAVFEVEDPSLVEEDQG